MAKKPKLNFGEADDHNFFAKHVEKMILAAVALLVVFFVYQGFSIEGIDSSKNPVQLRDQANNAKSNLDRTRWEDVMNEDGRVAAVISQRLATQGDKLPQTDELAYATGNVWNPIPFKRKSKRPDPPLFPPEDLEIVAGYGPIAMRGKTSDDLLLKAGLEAKTAEMEAKKKTEKRKKDDRTAGGYPGYSAAGGSAGGEYPGMGGADAPMYGSGPGGPGMYGGGGAGSDGPKATPEQLANIKGYRPGGASGGGGMMTMMGGGSGEAEYSPYGGSGGSTTPGMDYGAGGGGAGGTIPAGKSWFTIKALVPFKKQWTEWEHALQDAHDYQAMRDTPQYFYYQVERVEVDSDGQPIEGSAKTWTPDTANWYLQNWYAGTPDPILDPAYADPLLTNPCPPIMMRDLEPHQLHSKTPKRQLVVAEPLPTQTPDQAAPPTGEVGQGPLAMAGASGASGYNPYGAGMSGMSPPGMSVPGMSTPGMSAPGMSAPGMSAPGMSTPGMSAPGMSPPGMSTGGYNPYGAGAATAGSSGMPAYGSGGGSGAGMYGGSGMGMYGGSGMGMYGGGGQLAGPTVEYKLFRFYDFQVEPGKQYKYRVRLYLRDPNHPQDPSLMPPVAYLEDEVVERIRKIDSADAQKAQTTGKPTRTYWRETEWSEWSAIATLPDQYQILAGPATPERTSVVDRERGIAIPDPGSEPEASVLAMVFDKQKGADIPGVNNATRGTVLNFMSKANVLHPVNLQVISLPEYDFKTDVLVLDIRGGHDLPTTERATIDHKAPGEVLFMDADGKLIVRNELDDIIDYTSNIFKEPEKPKVAAKEEDGMQGYPGGFPGYGAGGPSGYGGGKPPRRGRGGGGGSSSAGPVP